MATPRQVAANRANAKKSTGPKSDSGKAVSASNARKHGLFGRDIVHESEDPAAFDALVRQLRRDMAPGSALEDELVDQLAMSFWRNKRLARAEQALLDVEGGTTYHVDTGVRRNTDPPDKPKYFEVKVPGNPDLNIKRMVLFGRYQAMITLEIRRTLQMFHDAQDRRINAIEAVFSDVTESDGVGSDVANSDDAQ